MKKAGSDDSSQPRGCLSRGPLCCYMFHILKQMQSSSLADGVLWPDSVFFHVWASFIRLQTEGQIDHGGDTCCCTGVSPSLTCSIQLQCIHQACSGMLLPTVNIFRLIHLAGVI